MRVERRVDVGILCALTPHSFCRQEAARSNRDSLVVNRQRALQVGNALLCLLQLVHSVAGYRSQVGDVVLQRIAHRLSQQLRRWAAAVAVGRGLCLALLLLQLLDRLIAG